MQTDKDTPAPQRVHGHTLLSAGSPAFTCPGGRAETGTHSYRDPCTIHGSGAPLVRLLCPVHLTTMHPYLYQTTFVPIPYYLSPLSVLFLESWSLEHPGSWRAGDL